MNDIDLLSATIADVNLATSHNVQSIDNLNSAIEGLQVVLEVQQSTIALLANAVLELQGKPPLPKANQVH